MIQIVIKPDSLLETGIKVEKVDNLNLFKFTAPLQNRLQELLDKNKTGDLTPELAIALYTQDLLSFGKARELARMLEYEFGKLLGDRGIFRHYGAQELQEDLTYAMRQPC